MEFERISERGVVFPLLDPYNINIYLIEGDSQVIICDTGCGPDHMQDVKQFIEQMEPQPEQIIILNSHHHYDHVWGNSVFEDASIYSHESCLSKLIAEGEKALSQYSEHKRGEVRLTLPNQPFPDRVVFDNGNIEFFYTPGHTDDSVSCIDRQDKVLFVGDNVETPIPFIYSPDLDQYIATLTEYLTMDWDVLVASHDPIYYDDTLIRSNIEYLEEVRSWEMPLIEMDVSISRHVMNLVVMADSLSKDDLDDNILARLVELEEHLELGPTPNAGEQLKKIRRLLT